MQVNLYIIFILHFWKQTREGKKCYSLYKYLPVSDLEAEPSSNLVCVSVNENPLQNLHQHQKQSNLEIVFYLLDHKSWETRQKSSTQKLSRIQLRSLRDEDEFESGSISETKHTQGPKQDETRTFKTKKPTSPRTKPSVASSSRNDTATTWVALGQQIHRRRKGA